MHEVRQVHSLAMCPVWQVAPHPDATDREGPGMFREHDIRPLGEILARAMYDNLNRFIVPSLAGLARLVPLTALVDKDLSLAALRQAAQRGRLDAVQSADGVDCRRFQRLARKLSRRGHSCASASWSAWKEVWPSAATVAGPYGSYGTRDPTPCPASG
jgi:hypothetical protein